MDNIFRLGAVLDRGFKIYFRNFVPFTLIAAVAYSPLFALGLTLLGPKTTPEEVDLIVMLLAVIASMLALVISAAVTYGSFEQLRGRQPGVGAILSVGVKRMFPVMLLSLVMMLGIMLGTLALVVPGLMLTCRWWIAVPVAVVEKPGILASLRRSSALTDGYRWQIFGAIFLLNTIPSVVNMMLKLLLVGNKASLGDKQVYLISVMSISVLMTGLTAVVTCVAYHDLRHVKEGVDTEELASVFD